MSNDTSGNRPTDHDARVAREGDGEANSEVRRSADAPNRAASDHKEGPFERDREAVTSPVDSLSSTIQDVAQSLTANDHPLGSYTRELSDSMAELSDRISTRSVDELAADTRRAARENPALFVLGGIAVGFAASRFLKASTEWDTSRDGYDVTSHEEASGNARHPGTDAPAPGDAGWPTGSGSDVSEGRSPVDQVSRFMREQPLVAGAAGIALGALVGSLLSPTRAQDHGPGRQSEPPQDDTADKASEALMQGTRLARARVENTASALADSELDGADPSDETPDR